MPKRIGNKRHFVKPNAGTKFRLVNRSIRDVDGYAEGAGQNVLAPIDEDYESVDIDDIKELERDCGVDFDDGYNYLQHMKVFGKITHRIFLKNVLKFLSNFVDIFDKCLYRKDQRRRHVGCLQTTVRFFRLPVPTCREAVECPEQVECRKRQISPKSFLKAKKNCRPDIFRN